ncbi:MAG: class I SAM-dependent methyltransferase [Actinomycetota bacterium]|nr:class I SAM-dependent methyltransferase [Actinomycetota bacterium]
MFQKTVVGPVKYRSKRGYDAHRFWSDRFRRYGGSLRGAGDEGLTEEENREIYREAASVLSAYVRAEVNDLSSARLLDIGCGPGFFTGVVSDLAVTSYTGIDITDVLFPELSRRFPQYEFVRRDVTSDTLEGEYDVVLMIDVAEHIVGDTQMAAAMANVRNVLAPGGLFVIGPLAERGRRHLFYVRFWSPDEIRQRFHGYEERPSVRFRNGSLIGFRRAAS